METKLVVNGVVEGVFRTKTEAKAQGRKRMRALVNGTTDENSLVIKYEKNV